MTWAKPDIDTNIGLLVGRDVKIAFRMVKIDPSHITLVIGDSFLEIDFDPATVEALRDKANTALSEFRERVSRPRESEPQGAAGAVS